MGLRAKKTVVDIAGEQFKQFRLPLNIEYKDYVAVVGTKMAISPISVKRSFKKWSVLLQALRKYHPELAAPAPEPAPAPKPAPKPQAKPAASKPAPKAAPKSKD